MSQQQRLPPSARVSVATGEDRLFSSTFFLISFFFFFLVGVGSSFGVNVNSDTFLFIK